MPDGLLNLDKIAGNMREPVRRYAATVRADLGDALKSLVMFGRVLGGTMDRENYSALSVIVLDAVDMAALLMSSPLKPRATCWRGHFTGARLLRPKPRTRRPSRIPGHILPIHANGLHGASRPSTLRASCRL